MSSERHRQEGGRHREPRGRDGRAADGTSAGTAASARPGTEAQPQLKPCLAHGPHDQCRNPTRHAACNSGHFPIGKTRMCVCMQNELCNQFSVTRCLAPPRVEVSCARGAEAALPVFGSHHQPLTPPGHVWRQLLCDCWRVESNIPYSIWRVTQKKIRARESSIFFITRQ